MKTIKMTIRLTEYEKRKLEQEAEKRGMNQSEVLRSLIARFPDPKDSVQNSSHTYATH
ncbi:MAG: CopG family transcriptional regulator [Moorea sp. SIO4G2]|nr:CopG family transcriptional regulator [Moorena sp. SIO4G2]NEQ84619.1 CopG family transcriptional regulator [Moorena sp. SIO2I5]